jgi:murein DD-endopeptidase MepM/ murein hydrolase activator NlpD
MGSFKPTLAKAPTSIRPEAEVSSEAGGREVSSDRMVATIDVIPAVAAAPIAVKLTNLVASIRAVSVPLTPTAIPSQPTLSLESSLVGPTIALAIAKQIKSPEAMPLPSLPIVYVDAKVDGSQNATQTIPAVAPCTDTGASLTVSYSVRTGLAQRLDQLGFTFPLPIPASITSAFGWRIHPITGDRRFHAGVDFGAPMGTPVMAALPGQVVAAGDRGGYGLAVIIENNAQRNLYAHLSGIAVQPGETVPAGSVIGWVGSTGNSTGPHLHFESQYLTPNGWQAVDPLTNGAIARGF